MTVERIPAVPVSLIIPPWQSSWAQICYSLLDSGLVGALEKDDQALGLQQFKSLFKCDTWSQELRESVRATSQDVNSCLGPTYCENEV